MTNHNVSYAGSEPHLQARCSCGKRSPVGDRGDCGHWQYKHLAEVQRIRSHLGTRSPSLASQQAWFTSRAEDPDTPDEDRILWRQLADEVGLYLTRKSALLEQDPLFDP